MSAMGQGVTVAGLEKIRTWHRTKERVERLQRQLAVAEVEAKTATHILGVWMSPDDAGEGEIFNLWFGSSLLRVERTKVDHDGVAGYEISWRKLTDKDAAEL